MERNLIYISETGSSVFDSQVLSLLREIEKNNFFNRILLLAGISENKNFDPNSINFLGSEIETFFFKLYPNYSFFERLQKRELISLLNRNLTDNTVIHLRGETLTGIIRSVIRKSEFSNVKILTDIRGVAIDEVRLYLKDIYNPVKTRLKLGHFKQNLIVAGSGSDHVSCVSESLKSYLLKYPSYKSAIVSVNPCGAGEDFTFSRNLRSFYRTKLGIADAEILCVYVTGGNGLYQNTAYIVSNITAKGYRILNLSKEKIQSKNVINAFVPNSEVPGYLCAADIGVVWRSDNVVNNVASPVKFSEYVCCGLPVIANNGVKLITSFINETGFGKIIEDFGKINDKLIFSLLSLDRNLISSMSRSIFSSEIIAKRYVKIYNDLLA